MSHPFHASFLLRAGRRATRSRAGAAVTLASTAALLAACVDGFAPRAWSTGAPLAPAGVTAAINVGSAGSVFDQTASGARFCGSSPSGGFRLLQTMTVGITGRLDQVQLRVSGFPGAVVAGDVTVRLYPLLFNGDPDLATPLASAPIPVAALNQSLHATAGDDGFYPAADFLPANIGVTVGQQLAIELIAPTQDVIWWGGDGYAGGQGVVVDPSNGVFFDSGCDSHFRTTVLPTFNFTGFFQPVDNPGTGPTPVLNVVKAGSGIPVKWSLGGDKGLNILAAGSPTSTAYACTAGTDDAIEQTVTAGNSSLSYDDASSQYVYVWKTDKTWANSCRRFSITLTDGTVHTAFFRFIR